MKRRPPLLKLIMFLVLGAIVNVAVAWGCAATFATETKTFHAAMIWSPPLWSEAVPTLPERDLRWLKSMGYQWKSVNGGQTLVDCLERHEQFIDQRMYFEYNRPDQQFSWVRNMTIIHPFGIRTRLGWPLRSMQDNLWTKEIGGAQYIGQWVHDLGLVLDPSTQNLFVPVGIIWPGFAINTIFYAAILWLLFAAPFALRRYVGGRRIKRGLCPACAYPVGSSDHCTECGSPLLRPQPRERG